MYFKAGLKKMTSRSVSLNNVIDLEVDHNKITLPSIKGLIFLNISRWRMHAYRSRLPLLGVCVFSRIDCFLDEST